MGYCARATVLLQSHLVSEDRVSGFALTLRFWAVRRNVRLGCAAPSARDVALGFLRFRHLILPRFLPNVHTYHPRSRSYRGRHRRSYSHKKGSHWRQRRRSGMGQRRFQSQNGQEGSPFHPRSQVRFSFNLSVVLGLSALCVL